MTKPMPPPIQIPKTAKPTHLLHTMLRVADLERSIDFYTRLLGMRLLRQERYPDGQFTLAFLGYEDESDHTAIELTHNWDARVYDLGNAYGHIALAASDIHATCAHLESAGVNVVRQPGPMTVTTPERQDDEHIAFITDPDGYRIELIQQ
jgi:lactoylglutathione lyase